MLALIKKYIHDYFPSAENDWFDLVRSKRTLADQINTAVLSLNSERKMHSHQRRVGFQRLKKYSQGLLASPNIDMIKRALASRKFHAVYEVLIEETKNHYMVSNLTAYDVTHRLCSMYGIDPEYVYLHTGVTVGAKNLGVNVRGKKYLHLHELPFWITSSLGAADIENFLCIYKEDFISSSRKRRGVCLPKQRGNPHC